LFSVLPLLIAGCGTQNRAEKSVIHKAEAALESCTSEFLRLTRRSLPDEVERAYVDILEREFGTGITISFVSGRFDLEHGPSDRYANYVVCSLSHEGEIVLLWELWKDALISEIDHQVGPVEDPYSGRVDTLIFERAGEEFLFSGDQ
jgi:hypothetical protein